MQHDCVLVTDDRCSSAWYNTCESCWKFPKRVYMLQNRLIWKTTFLLEQVHVAEVLFFEYLHFLFFCLINFILGRSSKVVIFAQSIRVLKVDFHKKVQSFLSWLICNMTVKVDNTGSVSDYNKCIPETIENPLKCENC